MDKNNKNDKWNAQHYKQHSQGQFASGLAAINEINLKDSDTVLDIGCGDGRITAEIAKLVPNGHVTGLDISANMIEEAKKSFGDIQNLEFVCNDAVNFSINKNFDVIVSFAAFHWVKNQQGALQNIYNHLKQGGRLVIKTGAVCFGPISEVYQLPKWTPLLSKKEQTYFPQTVSSFSKMLEAVGFTKIEVKEEVGARTFYKDKEALFNSVFAWVPHSTGLPDDKAREFAQDIVDRICASSKDGKICFETAILDTRAIR